MRITVTILFFLMALVLLGSISTEQSCRGQYHWHGDTATCHQHCRNDNYAHNRTHGHDCFGDGQYKEEPLPEKKTKTITVRNEEPQPQRLTIKEEPRYEPAPTATPVTSAASARQVQAVYPNAACGGNNKRGNVNDICVYQKPVPPKPTPNSPDLQSPCDKGKRTLSTSVDELNPFYRGEINVNNYTSKVIDTVRNVKGEMVPSKVKVWCEK